MELSSSGRNLITGDNDGVIKIWDTKSGRITQSNFNHGGKIYEIVHHPSKRVFATRQKNRVVVRSHLGKLYCDTDFKNTIRSTDLNGGSWYLVSSKKGIYIKDYKKDETIFSLKPGHSVSKAAFLNDSVILYNNANGFYTWAVGEEKSVSLSTLDQYLDPNDFVRFELDRSCDRIAVYSNRGWTLLNLNFEEVASGQPEKGSEISKVQILNEDLLNISVVPDDVRDSYTQLYSVKEQKVRRFQPDENYLLYEKLCWSKAFKDELFFKVSLKTVKRMNLLNKEISMTYEGLEGTKDIYDVSYSNELNRLYFKSVSGGISELDLNTGKSLRELEGYFFEVIEINGQDWLISLGSYDIEYLNMLSLKEMEHPARVPFSEKIKGGIAAMYYLKGKDVILIRDNENALYGLKFDKEKKVFDVIDLKYKLYKNEQIDDVNDEGDILTNYMDEEGLHVYFRQYGDKRNDPQEIMKGLALTLFVPGTADFITATKDSLKYWHFEKDGHRVKWTRKINRKKNREFTRGVIRDKQLTLGSIDGSVYVYDLETGEILKKGRKLHEDELMALTYIQDGNRLLTSGGDGLMTIQDVKKWEEVISIMPIDLKRKMEGKRDRSFLYFTPDNYYYAHRVPTEAFHYVWDYKVYTFDQFDIRFNRPDIVFERLNGENLTNRLYHAAYKKRLEKLGITELRGELELPEVKIMSRSKLPTSTEQDRLNISLKARSGDVAMEYLHVWVNGVPIYGERGVQLPKEEAFASEGYIEVPLVHGKNVIQVAVSATNGLSSLRETVEITRTGESGAADLYFVGIGVRQYDDASMNLEYSDKDVRDALQTFRSLNRYGTIHVDTFINERVTTNNLLGVKERLLNSKAEDMVVVFYSGHGLVDQQMDYYLSTHDVDFTNPSGKGLPFETLISWLDSVPAQKQLVLIDACHSGELDETNTSFNPGTQKQTFGAKMGLGELVVEEDHQGAFELMKTLFTDIRRENGATVIASSSGAYYSFEDEKYANGIFTYALKEGLGKGLADFNRDQSVTVSELKDYLAYRVLELTKGEQQPNSRIQNPLNDFKIAY